MKTVLEVYSGLWPASSLPSLKSLISDVRFINYPSDEFSYGPTKDPASIIVVMETGDIKESLDLITRGFEHVIQKSRPDFAQELLVSALMIARPKAFLNNPVPFLLNGLGTHADENDVASSELLIKFSSSEERTMALTRLDDFLSQKPKTDGIRDLCIQAADELISNAMYNAPINSKGEYFYQKTKRTEAVQVPSSRAAHLFCRFTNYKVVIGCEDKYGSLDKKIMMQHLASTLTPDTIKPRSSLSPSAGIGMRLIIGNAANFYMYCERQKRSMIACGFLTAGQKANLGVAKHLHFSFKQEL